MKQSLLLPFLIPFLSLADAHAEGVDSHFTSTDGSCLCQLPDGQLRLEFVRPDIVHVQFTRGNELLGNQTGALLADRVQPVRTDVTETRDTYQFCSDSLVVVINRSTGALSFKSAANGKVLMAEDAMTPHVGEPIFVTRPVYDESTRRITKTADGEKEVMDVLRYDTISHSVRYQLNLTHQPGEALYGLGQHMEDYMNLRGKSMYLVQHNLKAVVPVLNSTAGYGLLFDAGCAMTFTPRNENGVEGAQVTYESANDLDYYFMKGATMDKTVSAYRYLTGQVPMQPQYAFGYIQSKERYQTQDEVLSVVNQYRMLNVPLDLIVQDWQYWPQGWGYMKMDEKRFPNPALMADSLHRMNTHLMISIWPNASQCPQHDDFERRGYLLGGREIYDVFNPEARAYYWSIADREFFSKGFDAWWCDCSEPLDGDWVWTRDFDPNDQHRRYEANRKVLEDALGPTRTNLYSLYHAQGIYENQRLQNDRKRVMNLTRSSFAGQQRYGTITWNGDTHASWSAFAQMIPAGLNFMSTGCPYWTIDAGAFFTNSGRPWFWAGEYPKGVADLGYRELYVRMLQYATFLPLMRSHGCDTPREIWQFGTPGTPFYDAILKSIHLRYHMLPYIYSSASAVTRHDATMARPMAFDYPDDPNVFDLKDQYMFGPSIMVCPVTEPMEYGRDSRPITGSSHSRKVYFPKGDWYDFHTGQFVNAEYAHEGVVPADLQWREVECELDHIPAFVKAGSIIPLTEVQQYTGQHNDAPLTIRIYPGRNADFELYEDAGDSYDYEQGAFSTIKLHWDEARQRLSMSARKGSYEGMWQKRRVTVVNVRTGRYLSFTYDGKPAAVVME